MKKSFSFRIVCAFTVLTFAASSLLPPQVSAQSMAHILSLPAPGTMIRPSAGFTPALIRGVVPNPDNPLEFNFIVDTGDDRIQEEALRVEANRLVKYFLASLTVPEDELWVNLSPYEKDRVIADSFGVTEMGRDLLAQDYLLKQLTASLIYPEDNLGKKFWKRVHKKVYEKFGVSDIPTNTFNKVWIVPKNAVVLEHQGGAYVVESHLKVMLEEDYAALQHATKDVSSLGTPNVTSDIIREIIVPEIEKEVNTGEAFASLRQIYHSMILATWYKRRLRSGLLGSIYIDQNKVTGVDIQDKEAKQKIYDQYIEAFNKGVYDYIKEDYDPVTKNIIPRKYFSGGAVGVGDNLKVVDLAMVSPEQQRAMLPQGNTAQVTVQLLGADSTMSAELQYAGYVGLDSGFKTSHIGEAVDADLALLTPPLEFFTKLRPSKIPPAFAANFEKHGLIPESVWLSEVDPENNRLVKPSNLDVLADVPTNISVSMASLQALAGSGYAGQAQQALGLAAGPKFGKVIDAGAVKVGKDSLEEFAQKHHIVIIVGGNEGGFRDKSADLEVGTIINAGALKNDFSNVFMYIGDAVEVTNGVKKNKGEPGTSSMVMLVPLIAPSTDGYRISMAIDQYNPAHPFPRIDPVITKTNTLRNVLEQLARYMGEGDVDGYIKRLASEYVISTLDRRKHQELISQAHALGFETVTRNDGDPMFFIRAILGISDKNGKKIFAISTGGANEHLMSMAFAAYYGKAFMASTYASTETLKKVDADKNNPEEGSLGLARQFTDSDLENFEFVDSEMVAARETYHIPVPHGPKTTGQLGRILYPDSLDLSSLRKSPGALVIASNTGLNNLDLGVLREYVQPVTWVESNDLSEKPGKVFVSGLFINREGKMYIYRIAFKTDDVLNSRYSIFAGNTTRRFFNPLIKKYEETRKDYEAMKSKGHFDGRLINDHIQNVLEILRDHSYDDDVQSYMSQLSRLPSATSAHQPLDLGRLDKILRLINRFMLGRPFVNLEDESRYEIVQQVDSKSLSAKPEGVALATVEAIQTAYDHGLSDGYIPPVVKVNEQGQPIGRIQENDSVVIWNHRGDRVTQLVKALKGYSQSDIHFPDLNLRLTTMTNYEPGLVPDSHVALWEPRVENPLGEVLSRHGKRQLRVAETQRYPYVTYFMNGGIPRPFEGEEREMIPSKEGAKTPQMNAQQNLTDHLISVSSQGFEFITASLASLDLVGLHGDPQATQQAAEQVDKNVGELVEAYSRQGYNIIITGSHPGQRGEEQASSVPFLFIPAQNDLVTKIGALREKGRFADVAPTVLQVLGIERPREMTGVSLLEGYEFSRKTPQKVLLIVRDGWGHNPDRQDSSDIIHTAHTPVDDWLMSVYPASLLAARGRDVGLLDGEIANAEAGYISMGTGRVVESPLNIIRKHPQYLIQNAPALVEAVRHAKEHGTHLHLIGLLSDGRVHSSIETVFALLNLIKEEELAERVYIHPVMDGKDSHPLSGIHWMRQLEEEIADLGLGEVVSIVGRHIAMDRDRRWDRTVVTYRMLVEGEAERFFSDSSEEGDSATTAEKVMTAMAQETVIKTIQPKVIKGMPVEATYTAQEAHLVFNDLKTAFERRLLTIYQLKEGMLTKIKGKNKKFNDLRDGKAAVHIVEGSRTTIIIDYDHVEPPNLLYGAPEKEPSVWHGIEAIMALDRYMLKSGFDMRGISIVSKYGVESSGTNEDRYALNGKRAYLEKLRDGTLRIKYFPDDQAMLAPDIVLDMFVALPKRHMLFEMISTMEIQFRSRGIMLKTDPDAPFKDGMVEVSPGENQLFIRFNKEYATHKSFMTAYAQEYQLQNDPARLQSQYNILFSKLMKLWSSLSRESKILMLKKMYSLARKINVWVESPLPGGRKLPVEAIERRIKKLETDPAMAALADEVALALQLGEPLEEIFQRFKLLNQPYNELQHWINYFEQNDGYILDKHGNFLLPEEAIRLAATNEPTAPLWMDSEKKRVLILTGVDSSKAARQDSEKETHALAYGPSQQHRVLIPLAQIADGEIIISRDGDLERRRAKELAALTDGQTRILEYGQVDGASDVVFTKTGDTVRLKSPAVNIRDAVIPVSSTEEGTALLGMSQSLNGWALPFVLLRTKHVGAVIADETDQKAPAVKVSVSVKGDFIVELHNESPSRKTQAVRDGVIITYEKIKTADAAMKGGVFDKAMHTADGRFSSQMENEFDGGRARAHTEAFLRKRADFLSKYWVVESAGKPAELLRLGEKITELNKKLGLPAENFDNISNAPELEELKERLFSGDQAMVASNADKARAVYDFLENENPAQQLNDFRYLLGLQDRMANGARQSFHLTGFQLTIDGDQPEALTWRFDGLHNNSPMVITVSNGATIGVWREKLAKALGLASEKILTDLEEAFLSPGIKDAFSRGELAPEQIQKITEEIEGALETVERYLPKDHDKEAEDRLMQLQAQLTDDLEFLTAPERSFMEEDEFEPADDNTLESFRPEERVVLGDEVFEIKRPLSPDPDLVEMIEKDILEIIRLHTSEAAQVYPGNSFEEIGIIREVTLKRIVEDVQYRFNIPDIQKYGTIKFSSSTQDFITQAAIAIESDAAAMAFLLGFGVKPDPAMLSNPYVKGFLQYLTQEAAESEETRGRLKPLLDPDILSAVAKVNRIATSTTMDQIINSMEYITQQVIEQRFRVNAGLLSHILHNRSVESISDSLKVLVEIETMASLHANPENVLTTKDINDFVRARGEKDVLPALSGLREIEKFDAAVPLAKVTLDEKRAMVNILGQVMKASDQYPESKDWQAVLGQVRDEGSGVSFKKIEELLGSVKTPINTPHAFDSLVALFALGPISQKEFDAYMALEKLPGQKDAAMASDFQKKLQVEDVLSGLERGFLNFDLSENILLQIGKINADIIYLADILGIGLDEINKAINQQARDSGDEGPSGVLMSKLMEKLHDVRAEVQGGNTQGVIAKLADLSKILKAVGGLATHERAYRERQNDSAAISLETAVDWLIEIENNLPVKLDVSHDEKIGTSEVLKSIKSFDELHVRIKRVVFRIHEKYETANGSILLLDEVKNRVDELALLLRLSGGGALQERDAAMAADGQPEKRVKNYHTVYFNAHKAAVPFALVNQFEDYDPENADEPTKALFQMFLDFNKLFLKGLEDENLTENDLREALAQIKLSRGVYSNSIRYQHFYQEKMDELAGLVKKKIEELVATAGGKQQSQTDAAMTVEDILFKPKDSVLNDNEITFLTDSIVKDARSYAELPDSYLALLIARVKVTKNKNSEKQQELDLIIKTLETFPKILTVEPDQAMVAPDELAAYLEDESPKTKLSQIIDLISQRLGEKGMIVVPEIDDEISDLIEITVLTEQLLMFNYSLNDTLENFLNVYKRKYQEERSWNAVENTVPKRRRNPNLHDLRLGRARRVLSQIEKNIPRARSDGELNALRLQLLSLGGVGRELEARKAAAFLRIKNLRLASKVGSDAAMAAVTSIEITRKLNQDLAMITRATGQAKDILEGLNIRAAYVTQSELIALPLTNRSVHTLKFKIDGDGRGMRLIDLNLRQAVVAQSSWNNQITRPSELFIQAVILLAHTQLDRSSEGGRYDFYSSEFDLITLAHRKLLEQADRRRTETKSRKAASDDKAMTASDKWALTDPIPFQTARNMDYLEKLSQSDGAMFSFEQVLIGVGLVAVSAALEYYFHPRKRATKISKNAMKGDDGLEGEDAAVMGKEVSSQLPAAEGKLQTKGGIDLNPALLDLQIKYDDNGKPAPINQQPIMHMDIEGFIPVIINVTPVYNLPLLLGWVDTPAEGTEFGYNPDLKAREIEKLSYLN